MPDAQPTFAGQNLLNRFILFLVAGLVFSYLAFLFFENSSLSQVRETSSTLLDALESGTQQSLLTFEECRSRATTSLKKHPNLTADQLCTLDLGAKRSFYEDVLYAKLHASQALAGGFSFFLFESPSKNVRATWILENLQNQGKASTAAKEFLLEEWNRVPSPSFETSGLYSAVLARAASLSFSPQSYCEKYLENPGAGGDLGTSLAGVLSSIPRDESLSICAEEAEAYFSFLKEKFQNATDPMEKALVAEKMRAFAQN